MCLVFTRSDDRKAERENSSRASASEETERENVPWEKSQVRDERGRRKILLYIKKTLPVRHEQLPFFNPVDSSELMIGKKMKPKGHSHIRTPNECWAGRQTMGSSLLSFSPEAATQIPVPKIM